MRALTLWQPWAELVVLGIKWVETRSWSTTYRGPLLIHAAARVPASWTKVGDYRVRGFGRTGLALLGPGLPEYRSTPRQEGYLLPLGKVVATCTLADVAPMMEAMAESDRYPYVKLGLDDPALHGVPTGWAAALSTAWGEYADVTDQLPYGDFAPGRYAWLLQDVRPLPDPVPAKGHQRLWTPPPEVLSQVLARADQ